MALAVPDRSGTPVSSHSVVAAAAATLHSSHAEHPCTINRAAGAYPLVGVVRQSLGLSLLAFVVLDKIFVGAAGTLTEMPIVSIASACTKRRCPVPVQCAMG